nr:hypothetical protein [Mesorhizobium sp. AR02]
MDLGLRLGVEFLLRLRMKRRLLRLGEHVHVRLFLQLELALWFPLHVDFRADGTTTAVLQLADFLVPVARDLIARYDNGLASGQVLARQLLRLAGVLVGQRVRSVLPELLPSVQILPGRCTADGRRLAELAILALPIAGSVLLASALPCRHSGACIPCSLRVPAYRTLLAQVPGLVVG